MPDELSDFERTTFTAEDKERTVFRKGSGPAVIVISEIPGITPKVADFARRVVDAGFTAVMPHLFGEPGKEAGAVYAMQSLSGACVSSEFNKLALRKASPITTWLRALAKAMHEECGGPGVGVVGMCFTGGFALAMAVDDTVLAPVLSQPSLPFALTKSRARDVGVSDSDLARVKQRVDDDNLCVLGLRFTGDRAVPAARFERLREELGDGFVAVEIPGNKHSVLTEHFVDEPGHPTRDALEKVLDLFKTRLTPTG